MPSDPASQQNESSAWLNRFTAWLGMDEHRARWIQWAFLLACCGSFACLLLLRVGPQNKYSHDLFLLLDGGWRIYNGQVPFRDFYLALGPLEYMIVACGMCLSHAGSLSIETGNIVFGIAIGLWGWSLTRRRLPVIAALMLTGWLTLVATSPTPLGESSSVLSYAMSYNRHGYALLVLILVECACLNVRSRFWGGLSSGAALILLAFLKLNFFGAALLILLVTLPLDRRELRRFWGGLAGAGATLAAFVLYLHGAFPVFVADMRIAIAARSSRLDLTGAFGDEIAGRPQVLMLAILTLLAVVLVASGKFCQRSNLRMLVLGAMVIVSAPLFARSNHGESACELAVPWLILLVGMLVAAYPQNREKVAISVLLAMAAGGIFPEFFTDANSFRTLLQYQRSSYQDRGLSIAGQKIPQIKFYESYEQTKVLRYDDGHFLVDHVNDGLQLIKRSSTQNETILSLGYMNPFPYLLRRKPALGGSTWLQYGDNFPKNHPLDATLIFGNADLILLPNYPGSNHLSDLAIQAVYQPYLIQHFSLAGSSQWWTLYRRNR